ncbi:MAG: protein kinase domain-containing protein [Acidimicrobiales bacterium]
MTIEEHGPEREMLLPRQQFGRYQIVGLLGAGGLAAVYEALDRALDATVAVKVLGDNHCVDPDGRSRFINEARLLRKVGTERLVPVFDIGEQGGQPYFVMELIGGGTLAELRADDRL